MPRYGQMEVFTGGRVPSLLLDITDVRLRAGTIEITAKGEFFAGRTTIPAGSYPTNIWGDDGRLVYACSLNLPEKIVIVPADGKPATLDIVFPIHIEDVPRGQAAEVQ